MNLFKVVFDVASGNVVNVTPSDHIDAWYEGKHETLDNGRAIAMHLADTTTMRELASLGRQIAVIHGA